MKQTNRTLAILSFHKIGRPSVPEWDTWFYIPEEVFATQLQWLLTNSWHVLSAGEFLRGLLDPDTLPERSALLTFDDGYQSVATVALPCLRRFGFPAAVFVPTSYIGGTNAFDLDNEPEERMCTWEQLRRLRSSTKTTSSWERGESSADVHSGLPRAFRRRDVDHPTEPTDGLVRSLTWGRAGAEEMSVDEIELTLPADEAFYGVAHLVLGGLAVRLDLTIETLEDLELALDTLFDRLSSSGTDVTVRVHLAGDDVTLVVGPYGDRDLRTELGQGSADALDLSRILRAVCDDVYVEDREGGQWVELTKRVQRTGTDS